MSLRPASPFSLKLLAALFLIGGALRANPLSDIWDAFRVDTEEQPYGVYESVLPEDLHALQTRLNAINRKTAGLLGQTLGENAPLTKLEAAEYVYLLEYEIARVQLDISALEHSLEGLHAAEFTALDYRAISLFEQLQHQKSGLFHDMIRYLDEKKPGPNGLQVPVGTSSDGLSKIYAPNYRSSEPLSESQKKEFYLAKLNEAKAKGFDAAKDVLVLEHLEQLTRQAGVVSYEFVEMAGSNELRLTQTSAGHLVLAEGKNVLSAGQIAAVVGENGDLLMLLISPASGTYKPDPVSAVFLKTRLQTQFRIPSYKLVTGTGEPFSTQIVKLYMKADSVNDSVIKQKVQAMEGLAQRLLSQRVDPKTCAEFLSDLASQQ